MIAPSIDAIMATHGSGTVTPTSGGAPVTTSESKLCVLHAAGSFLGAGVFVCGEGKQ
jgi:hypothetical protein